MGKKTTTMKGFFLKNILNEPGWIVFGSHLIKYDLFSITSVHPSRDAKIYNFFKIDEKDWGTSYLNKIGDSVSFVLLYDMLI